MADSAGKKAGNFLVWIILVLLVAGLGGFGISNFGGSVQRIGTVGDEDITVDDYARALTQELRAQEAQSGQPMTLAEAQARGIVDRVRGQVITNAAFDNEVTRIGVAAGDAQVQKQVLAIDAFQGIDGAFDREAYRFTLQQNGLTEAEFEARIRKESARTLLQGAVLSGIAPATTYAKTLFDYIAARRSYSMIELTSAQLDMPVGAPDETALQAYYDAHPADFTAPETRAITYAWLTPDMILDSVAVDEDALRALYDERIDEFVQPERRLVERLVFGTEEEAAAAKGRLDSGEITVDALVAERGLELSDIDLGDMSEADLGAAGATVFALDGPGIAGPVLSDLGPALFRMNAVLAAQETTFDEAREDLQAELALDRARRIIADSVTDIDDRLAAGATLEEVAQETEMELGQIGYFNGQQDGIAAYDAFREAADAADDGDFPAIANLNDGGIFALRLDGVTPPALRPLDEVRDEATAGWQAGETRRLLAEKAAAMKARLDAGEAIEELGLTVETADGLTRGGITPPALTETVFSLEPGNSAVVDDANGVYLVRVDAALPADTEDQAATFLTQSLNQQAAQSIGQDLYTYFAQSLLNSADLTLDQAAINAVHAQFP